MEEGSIGTALDRIEAALDRIETAARAPRGDSDESDLEGRHSRLKASVQDALARIDVLLGDSA